MASLRILSTVIGTSRVKSPFWGYGANYMTPRFLGCGVNHLKPPIVGSFRMKHFSSMVDVNRVSRNETSNDRSRILHFNNGIKVTHIFDDEEFQQRVSKLRKYMSENEINACVFTSYHNINYFSGFIYCAFGRKYAHIVTENNCRTIASLVDAGQPWRRVNNDDTMLYTDWYKDNYFHAVKDSLSGIKGKIGFEFDTVSLEDRAKFESCTLPSNLMVDISVPVMHLRVIKSAAEQEVIKQAARIADIGGYAALEVIKEGVPEYEVCLHTTQTMVREIAKTYPQSDLMDTWTWFASGINTDGAHNPPSTRNIKQGDILSLNCFPMIQGYYAALERNLFLNSISDDHYRFWKINCEVHKRGIELIKPGARCCDIVEELNEIYRQNDLLQYRIFGYGHSFGILSHYYGREAALELREDVTTELKPGMVLSMEPMITIPDGRPGAGGYREHDILIVTENGAENITKFPFGPEKNIVKT